MAGCIVALGGGGFSMESGGHLDRYVLEVARRPRPRICFLPTASGDAPVYIARFYAAFAGSDCRPSHLGLFSRDARDPRAHLLAQDIIYVGGGNTANMLAIWRVHGLDAILREAWLGGTVLSGISAGAICWFEAGVTDSFGPELAGLRDGLGLLPGSCCPHYDGEAQRRPAYQRLVAAGLPAGLAVDDGAALRFDGTKLAEVVASRPRARAYRVRPAPGGVEERALPARMLS